MSLENTIIIFSFNSYFITGLHTAFWKCGKLFVTSLFLDSFTASKVIPYFILMFLQYEHEDLLEIVLIRKECTE